MSGRKIISRDNMRQWGKVIAVLILCINAVMAGPCCMPQVRGEQEIVYVSGNPAMYPVEYYDKEEETYKGIIPELLGEFSASSPYRVEYLNSRTEDERHEKYKNRQAELISGCVSTDGFSDEEWKSGVTVMQAMRDGVECEYRILFTDIAGDTFKSELTAFLSGITEQKRAGLLIKAVQSKKEPSVLQRILTAGILIAPFIFAIVIMALRYRKKLRAACVQTGTDEVTGIGNYDYMTHYYKQFITDRNRILYSAVYFYTDINRLRRLSDHQKANEFLKYIAVILNEYTADTDILARVADGGFALLKLSASPEELERWIQTVLQRIREYSRKYEKNFSSEVFAGIYRMKQSDWDLDAILFNAEQSCYYARKKGLSFAECTGEIIRSYEEECSLQQRIGTAFRNEEFLVYLHFFVDALSGKIVGAEALSRWEHPEKGLLTPGRYTPLMEREKSISQLDFYMLERVCRFLEELHIQQAGDFFISCNFSRDTFNSSSFVEECISIIQKYNFPREELILELTERGIAYDTDVVYKNAMKMKEYGVSIALDDFGSGCSDFFDLEKYHFDGLKLDKGLIDNLSTEAGQIILRGIIQIGHRLGMTILAEGAETEEQAEMLVQMNCDVIQGFYFFQPLPLQEARRVYLEQDGVTVRTEVF